MSITLADCLFGALGSGYLSDRFRRERTFITAAALFNDSTIGTGIVNSFTPLIIYRLIGGLGIGLASTFSLIYIAEISSAVMRVRLVSVNQHTIVIGILAAQFVNYLILFRVRFGRLEDRFNSPMICIGYLLQGRCTGNITVYYGWKKPGFNDCDWQNTMGVMVTAYLATYPDFNENKPGFCDIK